MVSSLDPSGAAESRESRQRARLLDAAGRCFAKDGFKRATIEDISTAASLSRPILYKHFPGKDALIDAVLDAAFDEWLEEIGTPDEVDSEDCMTRLRSKVRGGVRFAIDRPILAAILRQDPRVLVAEHSESFQRCHARSLEKTMAILEAGVRSGQIRAECDVARAAESIEMMLFALVERAIGVRPDYPFSDALVDSTLDLIVEGLRPVESAARGDVRA